jgi:hypothetical protein
VIEKSYAVNPRLRAPPSPGGFTRNFGPAFGRQLVPPRRSTLLAERLGDLVLSRIARVFLDLARQATRIALATVSAGRFCAAVGAAAERSSVSNGCRRAGLL